MKFPRSSGILLHITSLPGPYGIGELGEEAYRFVDFLESAGQQLWQVLPLYPIGFGNSPYHPYSVFAGNHLLISLNKLAGDGLLTRADLESMPVSPRDRVDYGAVLGSKTPLLKKAFENFRNQASPEMRFDFQSFCDGNSYWLDDYALFMALKNAHGSAIWNTWEEDIRKRGLEALQRWEKELTLEIEYHRYLQFQFFKQWFELKKYCNDRCIKLIGDVPIYVALDSADAWSHAGMFYLDSSGSPTVVAGVPPDYFSKTGQLWGNPLYRWRVMGKEGYSWWIERIRAASTMVDIIRLDHFRGFEKYWEIPAGETTAVNGRWVKGPGSRLFEAVRKELGQMPIIAEDLGYITPEVFALKDKYGFPGMKVLQFAFGSGPDNYHLPHHYAQNCVVYTGTHDNDTAAGWFKGGITGDTVRTAKEIEAERHFAMKYLHTDGGGINWDLIRLAFSSVADTAIVPLQDLLGLGSEARMNKPGTTGGNWEWRFSPGMLTDDIRKRLKDMTWTYGRAPAKGS